MMIVKLKDICTKIGSGATPRGGKDAYIDDGISLIRSQNILDFSFSHDGLTYINEDQARKLNGVTVELDDTLLNITGDSVARVCIVDNDIPPARVNQHVCILRGDKDKVLNSFILYFLQVKKRELLQMASGGATRNALTKGMIEELEIDLPSIKEQKKIVSILDSIQGKIKINDKINRNLSEQARALYKSWFIDFDINNGVMPEDWHEGTVSEIIELHDSKRKPLSGNERAKLDKIYPYYGATSVMDYVDGYLFDGIYMLLGEDGSVIDAEGYPILQYVFGKFWCNNHAHIITGKNGFSVEALYLLFSLTHVNDIVTGAVQPKISQQNLNKVEAVIPSHKILKEFDDIIQPMFEQIRKIRMENENLTSLRDSLLPKLMSGELDVSDLKI